MQTRWAQANPTFEKRAIREGERDRMKEGREKVQ